MVAIAFDTLKFVRKLKEAGVPEKQAEAQAEVLAEAFMSNLENLVTKDYLNARFAEQDARIDARFAALDTRFTEIDGKFRLVMWMLAVIMASTVLPALNDVMS